MSIFEIIMLICFGAAWPFSIYKSYKSKSTQGKSALFLVVILIGYAAGILNKLYDNIDNVVYLYVLNMLMVALDLLLYVKNQRLDVTWRPSAPAASASQVFFIGEKENDQH